MHLDASQCTYSWHINHKHPAVLKRSPTVQGSEGACPLPSSPFTLPCWVAASMPSVILDFCPDSDADIGHQCTDDICKYLPLMYWPIHPAVGVRQTSLPCVHITRESQTGPEGNYYFSDRSLQSIHPCPIELELMESLASALKMKWYLDGKKSCSQGFTMRCCTPCMVMLELSYPIFGSVEWYNHGCLAGGPLPLFGRGAGGGVRRAASILLWCQSILPR